MALTYVYPYTRTKWSLWLSYSEKNILGRTSQNFQIKLHLYLEHD